MAAGTTMRGKMRKAGRKAIIVVLLVFALGLIWQSENVLYLLAAVTEHTRIMAARQPVQKLIDSPSTLPEVRAKLELVLRVRQFASTSLALPNNGSYTYYVELNRLNIAWNVFAAPEFSTEPVLWCFPIAGCVVYRGHFSQDTAQRFAAQLRSEGKDVYVSGVTAYSTLGWYDDPILSTFLRREPADLIGLIIHELAHQQVYVKGDSKTNEGFAVAVEREGVRRWLRSQGQSDTLTNVESKWQHTDRDVKLLLDTQRQLSELYSGTLTSEQKRHRKKTMLHELRKILCGPAGDCEQLELPRAAVGEAVDLNNAYLVAVATYYEYVPSFETMRKQAADFPDFYSSVRKLARLSASERTDFLRSVTGGGLPLKPQ